MTKKTLQWSCQWYRAQRRKRSSPVPNSFIFGAVRDVLRVPRDACFATPCHMAIRSINGEGLSLVWSSCGADLAMWRDCQRPQRRRTMLAKLFPTSLLAHLRWTSPCLVVSWRVAEIGRWQDFHCLVKSRAPAHSMLMRNMNLGCQDCMVVAEHLLDYLRDVRRLLLCGASLSLSNGGRTELHPEWILCSVSICVVSNVQVNVWCIQRQETCH